MNTPQTQAKAIVAGILATLLAGASTLATVLTGTATLHSVTAAQWLAVLISMLASGGSVYGVTWSVTNAPPKVATQSADGSYNVTSLPTPAPAVAAPVEPLVPRNADQIVNGAGGDPASAVPAVPAAVQTTTIIPPVQ